LNFVFKSKLKKQDKNTLNLFSIFIQYKPGVAKQNDTIKTKTLWH